VQNDADLATFNSVVFPLCNKTIELKTPDGRQNVAPNAFPSWVALFFTGRGDDPVSGTVGAGPNFMMGSDTAGDTVVEWQFIDMVYMLGGIINFTGSQLGDYVDYMVYAPGTVTGSGSQQVNLVNVGPGNIIVPSAGPGMTTIDLTNVVPVPNETQTGFWTWSAPQVGGGTVTPNPTQTGAFDLYDFTVPLAHLANQLPLVGDNRTIEILVESVTSKQLLPQWLHVASVHNAGHAGLRVGWTLVGARARSV
jgi:hypothetical protein